MGGLKVKENTADFLNTQTYIDYLNRLQMLAMSRFEWKGLPDGVNPRYLEQTLFQFGIAVFYHDAEFGYVALQAIPVGPLNLYAEPVSVNTVNVVVHRTLGPSDAFVLIRNNELSTGALDTVRAYAYRLTQLERAIDINIAAQKTPVLLQCSESQKITLLNLYRMYNGNEPFIFGDKDLINKDTLKVLKTDAPFLADRLTIQKHNTWNECLSYLGIDNANTDKRERLITDEARANAQLIQLAAETALVVRKRAAAEINKKFPGLNVSVDFKALAVENDSTVEPDSTGSGDE